MAHDAEGRDHHKGAPWLDPDALPMFLRPPTPSQVAGTSTRDRKRLACAEERPDSDVEESDDGDHNGSLSAPKSTVAAVPLKTHATKLATEEQQGRRALVRKGSRGQIADVGEAKPVPPHTALAPAPQPQPQPRFREGHSSRHHRRRRSEDPVHEDETVTAEEAGRRGETQSFDEEEVLARKNSVDSNSHNHHHNHRRHHHHHHHHRKHSHSKHHHDGSSGNHRDRHHKGSSVSTPPLSLEQLIQAASQLPDKPPAITQSPTVLDTPSSALPPVPAAATQPEANIVGATAQELSAFASEWRGPRTTFAQYRLRRTKGGVLGRDLYEVMVEATGQPVLRARRRLKGGSPEYTIIAGNGKQPQEGVYSGTLRANMRKTEFVLSDGMHSVRCEVVYSPDKTADDPRGVRVLLSDDHCQTLLVNKQPEWSERLQSFVLDFNGRVKLPSIKNFQLARNSNSPDILFQFGRISETDFALDFKHPFTLLQAFGVAISAFN